MRGLSPACKRHPVIVEHDELPAALDHRTLRGEIERHDIEPLAQDVAPDIALGPIGEREDARGLARAEPAIQKPPHFGALLARVPAVARRAEGEHALLRPARLLVAPCAADGAVEAMRIERLLQALRFHHIGVERGRVIDGVDVIREPLRVHMHDQLQPELVHRPVAERDHVARLPAGIDVQQRKGRLLRPERLARQMQENGGILAD